MKTMTMLGVALSAALAAAPGRSQDRPGDALQHLSHCFDTGEFHARSRDHRTAGNAWRDVQTATGTARISVADGYRLMLYRDTTEPLVNLKIERSADGKFDADRDVVMRQLARLAGATKAPHQVAVETGTTDGVDVAALHNRVGTPGVVSLVTLFDAATGTIATAYILNQAPATRDYADQAGYDALRERFVGALAVCMAHARP